MVLQMDQQLLTQLCASGMQVCFLIGDLLTKMISSGNEDKKLPKALDKTVHELGHRFVSNNGFLRWITWPRG